MEFGVGESVEICEPPNPLGESIAEIDGSHRDSVVCLTGSESSPLGCLSNAGVFKHTGAAQPCGVGAHTWSTVLAYNADRLKTAPEGWADFWDV